MLIAIIKYGMGNITSVQKALNALGYHSIVTDVHDEIRQADFIVLPGVGSFEVGMDNLNRSGLTKLLTQEVIENKKPFLGICLGMQLLATSGNEPLPCPGLGWIDGDVVRIEINQKLKIPHLGWDDVRNLKGPSSFYQEFDGLDYYFIHSYHFLAKNSEDVTMEAFYGIPIAASLQKNNIYAVQFHPEKSQEAGMKLLKKIIDQYVKV